MSDTPKRPFGSSSKSKRKEVTLDLPKARQMLPLVRSIIRDIVDRKSQLGKLAPEQDNLEKHRRELNWEERERRYGISKEIAEVEAEYKRAVAELDELGLKWVDSDAPRVEFPTRINGKAAVFTWQPDEDTVNHWSYEDEDLRRPIPSEWVNASGQPRTK